MSGLSSQRRVVIRNRMVPSVNSTGMVTVENHMYFMLCVMNQIDDRVRHDQLRDHCTTLASEL